MKRLEIWFYGLIAALSVLWALADRFWVGGYDALDWRAALINLTGILAIGAMCAAMVLAMRPKRMEDWLDGLDKAYRLHKWLGIGALVFSSLHFLLINGAKAIFSEEELEAHGALPAEAGNAIFQFFTDNRGLAMEFGDQGFKVAVLLIALALIRKFPYRWFRPTHRLISLLFLFLAAHSIMIMDFSYWASPLGPVMAILVLAGCVAAVVSLLGRIGISRKAVGEIERLELHEGNQVQNVQVRLKDRWPGHREGQFAFVSFDKREGAHPFTIASSWTGDGRIGFFIKGLGDYTRQLPEKLQLGDLVTVEGPYGRFMFESDKPRQIWVAGGIGIAPFASRLKALCDRSDDMAVDLFYSGSSADDELYLERMSNAASRAKVTLHYINPERDGRLDAARIREAVPEWQEASIWFCGPSGFGESLSADFTKHGFPESDFHSELFEMR